METMLVFRYRNNDWIGYSDQVEAARNSYNKKGNDAELCAEDGVLKIKLTSEEFLSGFRKEDRLVPIITAVVYVGSKELTIGRLIRMLLFLLRKPPIWIWSLK